MLLFCYSIHITIIVTMNINFEYFKTNLLAYRKGLLPFAEVVRVVVQVELVAILHRKRRSACRTFRQWLKTSIKGYWPLMDGGFGLFWQRESIFQVFDENSDPDVPCLIDATESRLTRLFLWFKGQSFIGIFLPEALVVFYRTTEFTKLLVHIVFLFQEHM